MKNYLKVSLVAAIVTMGYGCNQENDGMEEMDRLGKTKVSLAVGQEVITFDHFTRGSDGFLTEVRSSAGATAVKVSAFRRSSANVYGTKSCGNIFDSGAKPTPFMQVEDICTPHTDFMGWGVGDGGRNGSPFVNDVAMGNLMIINRTDDASKAYDNNSGGKMVFDFTNMGTVTMNSITVMDVDDYEEGSRVLLYGANAQVLADKVMAVSGNNGKQIIDFGSTRNVARMEVILGPANVRSGSGAIDNLVFTREHMDQGCTLTQGYWKNHATGKKANEAWGGLADDDFFGSGLEYLQIMNTSVAGGNGYVMLAHQYIAAMLNMRTGASSTPEVDTAIANATAYFSNMVNGNYTNTRTSPYNTATKAQLEAWAGTLAAYNEGRVGPGHCD